MRSARPPGPACPVWPPVSHVHGPAVTVAAPAVMARLRWFSLAAAQPASADGDRQARGRAAAGARLRIPGGRHRRRRSRGDAAAYPPGPGMTGPPAVPGWDADQAVDVLHHAHYGALTRLAVLLVTDVAAAEEIVQAAFAAMHGAWQHLRDSEKALAFLLRKVVIGARSHHAASPAPPGRQPALPQAGQPAVTAPQALVAALQALPARQREALVLRYYADLPDTQIAAAMGTSAHAVTGHIRRGLSSLQAGQDRSRPPLPARHARSGWSRGEYAGLPSRRIAPARGAAQRAVSSRASGSSRCRPAGSGRTPPVHAHATPPQMSRASSAAQTMPLLLPVASSSAEHAPRRRALASASPRGLTCSG